MYFLYRAVDATSQYGQCVTSAGATIIYCGDFYPRWSHQMETFSALLTLCAGISPVSDEFPTHRPVARSFDVFFDLRLNKRLSKQSWDWWVETPLHPLWRHCNAEVEWLDTVKHRHGCNNCRMTSSQGHWWSFVQKSLVDAPCKGTAMWSYDEYIWWTNEISDSLHLLRRLSTVKSGPRLNIKTILSTYGDFHVKDKTAVRTSYL